MPTQQHRVIGEVKFSYKHLLRHFKNRKRQLRNSGKFKLKALQSLYWDDQQMQMHQAQIVYIEELFPRDHLNREAH